MDRGIVLLDAPVVPAAEKPAGGVEERGPDRDPAFREAEARLFEGDREQRRRVGLPGRYFPLPAAAGAGFSKDSA
jgi:hypothetical protein